MSNIDNKIIFEYVFSKETLYLKSVTQKENDSLSIILIN